MTLRSPTGMSGVAAWRVTPSWRQVLSALDQQPAEHSGEALPAAGICPLCSGAQLLILDDSLNRSQWYCCIQCGFAGGPERLLATVFGGSFAEGSAALFGHLLPAEETTLREHWLDSQYQTLRNLWEAAQARLSDSRGGAAKVAHAAGLRLPNSSWDRETTQQVIGGMPADELLTTLVGSTERLPKSRTLLATSVIKTGQPVLPPSFSDVVVLPFYDQPRRVTNFLIIGGARFTTKQTLLRLRSDSGAGLSYHPALLTDSRPILAVRDPIVGAQLQLRHFAADPTPLPVISWLCVGNCRTTVSDWRGFLAAQSRPVVFWADRLCLDTIHQAILVDGAISTRSPEGTDSSVNKFMTRLSASETVSLLIADSLPWRDYLREQINGMQDAEATNLLQQLLRLGVSSALLEPVCETAPRLKRLFSLVNTALPGLRVVTLDNGVRLEERNETWVQIKTSGEEVICPAVVHLQRAVNYPKAATVFYQGVVRFGGRVLPFLESADQLENNLGAWLHRFLLDQRCGYHPISPRWARKLFQVALKFQKPEAITGVETMGWDEDRRRFNLATFSISETGQLGKHRSLVLERSSSPPAVISSPKENKLPLLSLRRLLSHGLLSEAIWGLSCAVIGNVLAPALHEDRRGVACVGETGEAALRLVSRALGCPELPLSAATEALEYAHNWPIAVQSDKSHSVKALKDFAEQVRKPRNCLLPCSLSQAVPLMLSGGWEVFDYPDEVPLASRNPNGDVLGALFSEFLLWSCREHHATVLKTPGALTERVHVAMSHWLLEVYGATQLPELSQSRWLSHTKANACFIGVSGLLYDVLQRGAMELAPARFVNMKNTCWYTPQRLFVPRQDFVAAVAKLGGTLWPVNVTAALSALNNIAFLEEHVNGCTCWSFSKARWHSAVSDRRAKHTRLSKVAE